VLEAIQNLLLPSWSIAKLKPPAGEDIFHAESPLLSKDILGT